MKSLVYVLIGTVIVALVVVFSYKPTQQSTYGQIKSQGQTNFDRLVK